MRFDLSCTAALELLHGRLLLYIHFNGDASSKS